MVLSSVGIVDSAESGHLVDSEESGRRGLRGVWSPRGLRGVWSLRGLRVWPASWTPSLARFVDSESGRFVDSAESGHTDRAVPRLVVINQSQLEWGLVSSAALLFVVCKSGGARAWRETRFKIQSSPPMQRLRLTSPFRQLGPTINFSKSEILSGMYAYKSYTPIKSCTPMIDACLSKMHAL